MAQISYTNKVALNENPEIADINKVTDDDMNEIKQVVNDNYNNTIVISDTQPTSEDNKIWIDTGEVQNLGSEVHIGTEVDSKIGLNILYSRNLFDKNTITSNYYYDASGNYTASNNVCVSDYIEVQPNKVYKLESADIGTYTRRINFFNSSKQWLSQQAEIRTNFKIVIPNDCKYVRISGNINLLNNTFIFKTNPIMIVDNEEGYNTNEMYSNSEIVVGEWTNGKKLYQRTISTTTPNVTTNGTAEWNTTSLGTNIDMLYIYDGFIKYGQNIGSIHFSCSSSSSQYFARGYTSIENGTAKLHITSNSTTYNGAEAKATIRYTKTTD